jgi:hypothetical protein
VDGPDTFRNVRRRSFCESGSSVHETPVLYVNLVVFLVRPNPFDPENAFFEIYRGYQPIAVGQDIENKYRRDFEVRLNWVTASRRDRSPSHPQELSSIPASIPTVVKITRRSCPAFNVPCQLPERSCAIVPVPNIAPSTTAHSSALFMECPQTNAVLGANLTRSSVPSFHG